MSTRKRIGTALKNIRDIGIFGYPKEQDYLSVQSISEDKENHSLSIDKENLLISDNSSDWKITLPSVTCDKNKKVKA